MDHGLLDRIRYICHTLEHSLFLTEEQRAQLKEELADLQKKLENLRKVMYEIKSYRPKK